MHYPSFDEEINGINFTFAPIASDESTRPQYTVMADDLIFRMTFKEDGEGYVIKDGTGLPDNVVDLEEYLSNTILTRERKEDESNAA